ncbi:MAG: hypothetical protein JSV91_02235 [Phycisphaerales bacterium]|nr:MAG: hypothetical protein JSV91_02235 [Phycisphaerales bacterium]
MPLVIGQYYGAALFAVAGALLLGIGLGLLIKGQISQAAAAYAFIVLVVIAGGLGVWSTITSLADWSALRGLDDTIIAIDSADRGIRLSAAEKLRRLTGVARNEQLAAITSALMRAAGDEDARVRLAAIEGLAILEDRGQEELFVRSLRDESPEVSTKARAALEKLGLEFPDIVNALYRSGIELALGGRCDEAVKALSCAGEMDPADSSINLSLTFAQDCAHNLAPKEAVESVFASLEAVNEGEWNEALIHARRACEQGPEYAPAFLHLGTVYRKLRQEETEGVTSEEVIQAYLTAVELEPEYGPAHHHLAMAYDAAGLKEESSKHLELASAYGIGPPAEAAASAGPEAASSSPGTSDGQEREKGHVECFVCGLMGPIVVLFGTVASFFDPEQAVFIVAWDRTWGDGNAAYRFGFMVGIALCIMIISRITGR